MKPFLKMNHPDGSPYRLDRDSFGASHSEEFPRPDPFATPPAKGKPSKMWPVSRP